MRTTLLNPTVWLLAATGVAACIGAARGRQASEVVAGVLRYACAWPVLLVLGAVAALGLGSRVVLGYLAPGAYAEEVVAARSFLETGQLYSADAPPELSAWLSGSDVPWGSVPGVTPCQANALTNRELFYTEHAHPPTLLLAGVPVVAMAGPRGLYAVFLILSLAAVVAMWVALAARARVALRSSEGLLILIALCAWQPVLASVRQGDAVLLAAGLVAFAWHAVERGRGVRVAAAGAIAACLTIPAIGVPAALVKIAPRRGGLAIVFLLALAGVTGSAAGFDVLPTYVRTVAETATTYAEAIPNYALAGRLLNVGGGIVLWTVVGLVVLVSWMCAKSPDAAFSVFAAAGLIVAPILWSQHLTLALVPAAVLFSGIVKRGSPTALAAWALLMLLLSLPDPALIALTRGAGVLVGPGLPVVPFAVIALWMWTVLTDRHAAVTEGASASATPARVLS